jgi:peptidyl-prolyl cis-trans isomerase D
MLLSTESLEVVMIGFWRRRSKTFVVHLVFWPIIMVFVIWGIERYDKPAAGASAAIVNDRVITMQEYRNALQRMIDFYSQLLQGNFDEDAQRQYKIRETALQQLINSELIAEQAHNMGLWVTDEEVRTAITEIPVLQKNGRFSRENYDSMLRYYRMSPSQFESGLRKDALLEKSRKLFERNIQPSRMELEKEKALRASKINLEYLRVDRDELMSKMEPSSAQVQEFLKDPNGVKEAKEYYDLRKSEYVKDDQVKASHILIKAPKGDAAQEAAAKQKLAKIQEELKTSTFAEVAKKYSDDPGSKMKGGDLGWFTKGRMVPEFEKTAFELNPGQVSGPIQTDFGFHLIKVEGKKPAETTTFETARNEIAKKIVAGRMVDKVLKDAEGKLATDPQAAVKEVMALGKSVKWEETGAFTLGDERVPKIGDSDELMAEAFNLRADKPYVPRLINLGSSVYVLRLKNRQTESNIDVAKIKEEFSRDFARDVYYSWSQRLREKAKIVTNPAILSADVMPE